MKLIYIFLILEHPGPSQRLKKTIDIDTHKVLLKESGVNLTLTIVDTPGTYLHRVRNRRKTFLKIVFSTLKLVFYCISFSRIFSIIFLGFGDAVDNSNCWDPVISYVESQYESFLDAETRVHRVQLPDTRVHVCLYFIAPSGHGLKPLDVEFMKRLHDKVNVVPVIGKSGMYIDFTCFLCFN